jgi:GTPase SAR1 family protein
MESSVIKIHILGEGGVGKSAVTMSLIRSRFTEEYDPTIGMHVHPHAIALLADKRKTRGFLFHLENTRWTNIHLGNNRYFSLSFYVRPANRLA